MSYGFRHSEIEEVDSRGLKNEQYLVSVRPPQQKVAPSRQQNTQVQEQKRPRYVAPFKKKFPSLAPFISRLTIIVSRISPSGQPHLWNGFEGFNIVGATLTAEMADYKIICHDFTNHSFVVFGLPLFDRIAIVNLSCGDECVAVELEEILEPQKTQLFFNHCTSVLAERFGRDRVSNPVSTPILSVADSTSSNTLMHSVLGDFYETVLDGMCSAELETLPSTKKRILEDLSSGSLHREAAAAAQGCGARRDAVGWQDCRAAAAVRPR